MKFDKNVIFGGVLIWSHLCAASPHEVNLSEILGLTEKASHAVPASEMRGSGLEATASAARAGFFPKIDLQAIDSTGFPGSTGVLGVGGVIGSPYRSGPAVGLVAKQTVWDFGRTSLGVDVYRHQVRAQKQETQLVLFDVDREATRAFFDCARYTSQRETWTFVLKEAELISKEVGQFVATGQRSVVEKYLAQSQVEEALTAEADFDEKTKQTVKQIGILTNLAATNISCPKSLELTALQRRFQLESAENPRTLKASEEAQAAESHLAQIKADYLPTIVALGAVGFIDKSRLVPKQDYAFGIGVNIPIFEGFRTSYEVKGAEAAASEKQFLVQANREQVDQLNSKFDLVIQSSQARLAHLFPELQLANDGFRVAKERYFSFRGSLVDVREALRNLTRTRIEINNSQADYLEATTEKLLFNGKRSLLTAVSP